MKTGDLRRLLLDLAGLKAQADPDHLAACTAEDWQRMHAMADMHRLSPWLHWLHKDNTAIPGAIADAWRESHRVSAITALVWQAELRECVELLQKAGFTPVALKGAFLAAHAYPEAALRPMRDIDLILPREEALPAFDVLQSHGYTFAENPKMALADYLATDKHLPLMVAPRGTPVELHWRLSHPDGKLYLEGPQTDTRTVIERAHERDGISYPAPDDMLDHLIVHAVYEHWFDCGPLVISDIEYLTRLHSFDWPSFWQRTERDDWRQGAALVMELVRRFNGGEAIDGGELAGDEASQTMLETVPDLMLQDLESRRGALLLSGLASSTFSLFRQHVGRTASAGASAGPDGDARTIGEILRWSGDAFLKASSSLLDSNVRAQSRDYTAFRKWLEEEK